MANKRFIRQEECDTFQELPKLFQEIFDRLDALENPVEKPAKKKKGDSQ